MIILEKNLQFSDVGKVYTIGNKENGVLKPEFDFLICNTQIIVNSHNPKDEQKERFFNIETNKNNVLLTCIAVDNVQMSIYRTEKHFYIITTNILNPEKVEKLTFELISINFVENTPMNKYNAITDYEE